ncbi:MAG: glutamyl-tRNA synthetase [Candidatus Bathyarchaeota archaeon B23]|nr:MAG: glutamyl-tRNA synthetase [Candidatus Bathyarchaeota archaeon B23]
MRRLSQMEGLREEILKWALLNAVRHEGEARIGPVMSRLLGEHPQWRSRARELTSLVREVVDEVNSWSPERQRGALLERWPQLLEERPRAEERRELPPLPNVDRFREVRTRFAPNPDGPLHLGNARPVVLCHEYARRYDGSFILRYEDTSPDVKAPILEMYDAIMEDLRWLGAEPDEVYHQSDRLELYYRYARRLIDLGAAYVCTCPPERFRELYMRGEACPCRGLSPPVHLDRWEGMLGGRYRKGEAVVRIKTDLRHPNPAVRDWPALRVATAPHPRVGTRYRVWPLYNFSCAIDDHEMEVSHIIRGKEHEVNTVRQRYLYSHLEWEYPEVLSVGRLSLEAGVLSKSRIRAGIEAGIYRGWDDPRLGTLMALRRRGIQPEAVRMLMIEIGPKGVEAKISWDNIAALNRRVVEPRANRYFFVDEPTPLWIEGLETELRARLPLHPDHPERGVRTLEVEPSGGVARLLIARRDAERLRPGSRVRLMGLLNLEVSEVNDVIEASPLPGGHVEAREMGLPFIHWLPEGVGVEAEVVIRRLQGEGPRRAPMPEGGGGLRRPVRALRLREDRRPQPPRRLLRPSITLL